MKRKIAQNKLTLIIKTNLNKDNIIQREIQLKIKINNKLLIIKHIKKQSKNLIKIYQKQDKN